MPQAIAIHGVVVPVTVGLGLLLVLLVADAVLRSRARRRFSVSSHGVTDWFVSRVSGGVVLAPVIALVFVMSFHARQGVAWPPPTLWEWIAPAVVAAAAAAWLLPAPVAVLAAAVIAAWALTLPGFKEPAWRIGIGACVLVLGGALAFAWGREGTGRDDRADRADRDDRATRTSEFFALAVVFAGLAGVVIASGFEKLTTNVAAVSLVLTAAGGVAFFVRSLRVGAAGALTAAMVLVSATTVGAAYAHDAFPFWHWPVAVAAPLAALVPELPLRAWRTRSGARAVVRVAAVAVVSLGNAAAALGPLIARGEFPPQ